MQAQIASVTQQAGECHGDFAQADLQYTAVTDQGGNMSSDGVGRLIAFGDVLR
ncbi:hypothetical protein D9M71_817930 [compost metagenome]